ncbi:unnamed protein product [Rotaria magnacalcarata]|uniref:Uncharacterized protein n=1 Tax=Rotaria magnacalcarata TaxID=392030 RepID=A0A8S2TZF7_9BILA|nr:unnamed protein product [Rotaria magnacalcarata]
MSIPIIHYRLFVDNKPHEASQSIIVLVGFSLKCCPVRPDTLDHLRVLELMNVEELSTILSSPEFIATDNLTLVISDGTIDSCRNILNKFSGSVYTFDAKRSLIYSSVNVLRHIGLTVNPVLFESKYRQRFFELTTDIAQYIDVFAQNYRREDAAYWYSRDWFLFRTLNEALHQENYDTIIKLRCFIRDLHNQLAALQIDYLQSSPHNQPNIVLYRGQTIPRSEIEWLQRYQCSLISMNSFLSTTNSYQAAVFFSGEGTADVDQGYVSVIFEILVDTRLPLNVPFARINYQSIFQDEEEILFSMATTFRIQDVEKIRDNFWCVKIKLEKNLDDEQWQLLTSHLNA